MSARPPSAFIGRNGFAEYLANAPAKALDAADPSGEIAKANALNAVTEAQELAHYVLQEMGSHFPSFAEMKSDSGTKLLTLSSVKERIAQLNKEHREGFAKLYAFHAKDLEDDAMDMYLQTDDLWFFEDLPNSNAWKAHYDKVAAFYKQQAAVRKTDFTDVLESYIYDHLRQLQPLYRRRVELEQREERERAKQEAQFPQTVSEYTYMASKPARLRIARFLMADKSKKEQMSTESNWAWRQTQPLILEYAKNAVFQSDVEAFVKENESRDPRNRPPAA